MYCDILLWLFPQSKLSGNLKTIYFSVGNMRCKYKPWHASDASKRFSENKFNWLESQFRNFPKLKIVCCTRMRKKCVIISGHMNVSLHNEKRTALSRRFYFVVAEPKKISAELIRIHEEKPSDSNAWKAGWRGEKEWSNDACIASFLLWSAIVAIQRWMNGRNVHEWK